MGQASIDSRSVRSSEMPILKASNVRTLMPERGNVLVRGKEWKAGQSVIFGTGKRWNAEDEMPPYVPMPVVCLQPPIPNGQ